MKPRGFTLIELCMAMAILGVLLALAAPSMAAMIANSRIKSAKEQILAGINSAKSEAIRNNTSLRVVLTPTTLTTSRKDTAEVLKTLQISSSSSLSISAVSFFIDSLGRVSDAGAPADPATAVWLSDIAPAAGSCTNEVRCYRIQVLSGGLIKACNQSQGDVNDPSYCL
jgi:prepilin-type N-terminal cleavage/methylation domain-containing protein